MIRIPTGGRQTSWLFTRMDRGVEPGTYPEQHQLDLNPGHRIEIQRPNHSAILPPIKIHDHQHWICCASSLPLV